MTLITFYKNLQELGTICPGARCGFTMASKPESNADFYWGLCSLSPLSNSNDMHVKYIMANFLTISASVIKVAF